VNLIPWLLLPLAGPTPDSFSEEEIDQLPLGMGIVLHSYTFQHFIADPDPSFPLIWIRIRQFILHSEEEIDQLHLGKGVAPHNYTFQHFIAVRIPLIPLMWIRIGILFFKLIFYFIPTFPYL
jgi:hypothetical protein